MGFETGFEAGEKEGRSEVWRHECGRCVDRTGMLRTSLQDLVLQFSGHGSGLIGLGYRPELWHFAAGLSCCWMQNYSDTILVSASHEYAAFSGTFVVYLVKHDI